MKLHGVLYGIKQGFQNIWKHKWFSIASIITLAVCIYLLGISYLLVVNVEYMVEKAGETVGVTIFFEEGIADEQIEALRTTIEAMPEVKSLTYISAEEAWEIFKDTYFSDNPELADGFKDDNPLANSASFEVYLEDPSQQAGFVSEVKELIGVRDVNYSALVAGSFTDFSRMFTYISAGFILILLVVSMFLISNAITNAYQSRKKEIEIMKWLGATKSFVRFPFLVEGFVIGVIGAALPVAFVVLTYMELQNAIQVHYRTIARLISFVPLQEVFPIILGVSLGLGAGLGVLQSFFTIRKQVDV